MVILRILLLKMVRTQVTDLFPYLDSMTSCESDRKLQNMRLGDMYCIDEEPVISDKSVLKPL